MSFEIVSAFNAGHGLMMLQCKQTETVDPILDLAPPTADAADAAAAAADHQHLAVVCEELVQPVVLPAPPELELRVPPRFGG